MMLLRSFLQLRDRRFGLGDRLLLGLSLGHKISSLVFTMSSATGAIPVSAEVF
jgi:hypothetical protein